MARAAVARCVSRISLGGRGSTEVVIIDVRLYYVTFRTAFSVDYVLGSTLVNYKETTIVSS